MNYTDWIKKAVAITRPFPKIAREIITDVTLYYIPKGTTEQKKITVKALWDTGAQCTMIHRTLEKTLDLNIVGHPMISGVDGIPSKENSYVVDVSFHNERILKDIIVTSSGFILNKFSMIIGMDIIGAGDFFIGTGKTSDRNTEFLCFSFAHPSASCPKDFVKEIMKTRNSTPTNNKILQERNLDRKKKGKKSRRPHK
jgi:hypothetical protein